MKRPAPKHVLPGLVAAVSLSPLVANAGALVSGGFLCARSQDGSGYCTGTHDGARNSHGSGDQVSFALDNTGFAYFGALYDGGTYGCTKTTTADSLDALVWNAAASSRNYFYVTWNAAGTCEWVYIGNFSAHQDTP